ncbi:MAG TPA: hypothetical protein VN026_18825 [Bacteroidia bacterium]|jgi:hypothetical protein|nr:hypothetical protein [Bacteroidia bacterium]
MNDFKKVFSVVVSHCTERRSFELIDCFEMIAKEARIPLNELDIYLSLLQEFGHIKYSIRDRSISLTSFNNKKEKQFCNLA